MTVYAVRQGSCVNNFAIETAEINIEVKHHLKYKKNIENLLNLLLLLKF
jgi:hypothetical protein